MILFIFLSQCPTVFAISDNEKCISLKGYRWIQKFVAQSDVTHFIADGSSFIDVYEKSKSAIEYTR